MGDILSDQGDNGGFWQILLAGFVNPSYFGPANVLNSDATGFSIAGYGQLVIGLESPGAAVFSVVHEQTLDPTGLVGWFQVAGKPLNTSTGSSSTTVTALNTGYSFPAMGVRHRMRCTALTVADLRARVMVCDHPFDQSSNSISATAGGQSAQDAAIAGAPLPIGLDARNVQKASMSASGDVVYAQGTMDGKQIVRQNAIPELEWAYPAAAAIATAVSTTIKAAAGAAVKNYLTSMQLTNAGATGTEVRLKSSVAGTVIWRDFMPPGAKSNVQLSDPLASIANGALELEVVTAGAAIWANAQGYTAP